MSSVQRLCIAALTVLLGTAGCASSQQSPPPSTPMPPSSSPPPSPQSTPPPAGQPAPSQPPPSGMPQPAGAPQPPAPPAPPTGAATPPPATLPGAPAPAADPPAPGIPEVSRLPEMPRPPSPGEGDQDAAGDATDTQAGAGTVGAESEGETAAGAADAAAGTAGTDATDGAANPAGTAGTAGVDDDGWVTSNQIPGAGADGQPGGAAPDGPPGRGRDSALDRALEGLDGQILAERAVIQARANETADPGAAGTSASAGAGDQGADGVPDANGSSQGTVFARTMPGIPTNRTAPPGPRPAAGALPDDIPTGAQDDDIIARQLREAAMQETDPELRDKLWDEYRRYKGI
jgi:hypothetical protein